MGFTITWTTGKNGSRRYSYAKALNSIPHRTGVADLADQLLRQAYLLTLLLMIKDSKWRQPDIALDKRVANRAAPCV